MRKRVMAAIAAVVVLAVVLVFWLRSRGHEATDDAQVDGRITQIAAKVGGPVLKVNVDNNNAIGAGTVLVQIDPRDYEVAVEKAKAELADAQANAAAATTNVPISRIETTAGVNTASGGVQQAEEHAALPHFLYVYETGARHQLQQALVFIVSQSRVRLNEAIQKPVGSAVRGEIKPVKRTTRLQYAHCFLQSLLRLLVFEMMKHERREHSIERTFLVRKLIGETLIELH